MNQSYGTSFSYNGTCLTGSNVFKLSSVKDVYLFTEMTSRNRAVPDVLLWGIRVQRNRDNHAKKSSVCRRKTRSSANVSPVRAPLTSLAKQEQLTILGASHHLYSAPKLRLTVLCSLAPASNGASGYLFKILQLPPYSSSGQNTLLTGGIRLSGVVCLRIYLSNTSTS